MMRLIVLDKIRPIDFPSYEMDGLDVVQYLNTLPTVDPEELRPKGRWETVAEEDSDFGTMVSEGCSACGMHSWRQSDYCPNCGAKMEVT